MQSWDWGWRKGEGTDVYIMPWRIRFSSGLEGYRATVFAEVSFLKKNDKYFTEADLLGWLFPAIWWSQIGWPGSITGVPSAQENVSPFGAEFVNCVTIAICSRIILCCGDCPLHCRMFSSLCPSRCLKQPSSNHCNIAKCPLGSKINSGGEPLI